MEWKHRHRWQRVGSVIEGTRGSFFWREECIFCGAATTSRRKNQVQPCCGPKPDPKRGIPYVSRNRGLPVLRDDIKPLKFWRLEQPGALPPEPPRGAKPEVGIGDKSERMAEIVVSAESLYVKNDIQKSDGAGPVVSQARSVTNHAAAHKKEKPWFFRPGFFGLWHQVTKLMRWRSWRAAPANQYPSTIPRSPAR